LSAPPAHGESRPSAEAFLHAIFNYILKLLYLGCQWELPIEKNKDGRPETHYIRIYRAFSYEAHGCFDAIFEVCVAASPERIPRHQRHPRRWYDDSGEERRRQPPGTSTSKGMLLPSAIATAMSSPLIAAPNRNESPLKLEALPQVTRIAKQVGLDLNKTIVSLDGVYDSRANRKAIFNRGMVPNIPENLRGRKTPKRGRKPFRSGHLSGTVSHHRASLRLGG